MIDPDDPQKTLEGFDYAWGIYDTRDKCWVGNDKGPLRYVSREFKGQMLDGHYLAMAAATIVNERMRHSTRFRAMVLEGGPMHMKDEVQYARTTEDAIRRIEGGRSLPSGD